MKDYVWRFAVFGASIIPEKIRELICTTLFAATAKEKPEKGSRSLLRVSNRLGWFIDQAAINYDGGIHPKHRLTEYHFFFTERLVHHEKVLDVGCGTGAVSHSLAASGAMVTGIDVNGQNIRLARKKFQHQNLEFIEGDITQRLPDRPFRTIVLSNVLEHIERRKRLLQALLKTYHPKRMLIRVPMVNRDWSVPFKKELGLPYFSDPTHHTEYTEESFEREMVNAGCVINHKEIKWGEIWAEVIPAR